MDLIDLRAGPTVPRPALELALRLERRGVLLRVDRDQLIVVPPAGDYLTDDDRDEIRQWKAHLLALLAYQAPPLRSARVE